MVQNKQFVYKQLPDGYPKPGQDVVVETGSFDPDAAPPKGGLTTKNYFSSLDPYLRAAMRPVEIKSYSPAMVPGNTIRGYGIAKVLKSDTRKVKPGDYIHAIIGAEEYSVIPAPFTDQYDFHKIPSDTKLPLSYYCGALGMPGRTAYASLYEIGAPKKGETIWVSAASGPVGQIVGQLAKHNGLKVIGSVGSDDKLDFIIKETGFDSGFNYKKEKPLDAIHRLAPDGIDIYYDNVGGEHLEAALETLNDFGRIGEQPSKNPLRLMPHQERIPLILTLTVSCGQVSQYNLKSEDRYPIKNTYLIVGKRIKNQGFIVFDANQGPKYFDEHQKNITKWLLDGSFKALEDVTAGLDKAPEAFLAMLKGENFGKAVIKIADLE
ncbi:hypothetical protein MMC10_009212 [Thelotrema lepadinum]|nr:hypothetical protein [Thelotrema lepadinum]